MTGNVEYPLSAHNLTYFRHNKYIGWADLVSISNLALELF